MQIKFKIVLFFLAILILASSSYAEEIYLSLKKDKVNVRYGPSFKSPIKYIYKNIKQNKLK